MTVEVTVGGNFVFGWPLIESAANWVHKSFNNMPVIKPRILNVQINEFYMP